MPLTPATDLTLLSENRQRLVYREGGKVFAALASGTSEQTTYTQIGSIKGLFKVELTPITVPTASQQSRAVGADLVATFELVQTFEIEKEALAVFAGKKCKVLVQVKADKPGDNLVETTEEYEFTDQFITPSEIVSALYESVIPMEVRRRVSIQKYIKMTSYSVNVSLDAPTLTWGELRNLVVETTDRSRAIDGSDRGTHYNRAQMVHRDLFRLQVTNAYVSSLSVADQAAIRFEVDFYNWTEWQNRLTSGVPFTSLSLTKVQVFDASYQLTPLQQASFFRSSGWNFASAAADRLQKIVYCRIRAKLGLAVSSWTEFAWVSAPFRIWDIAIFNAAYYGGASNQDLFDGGGIWTSVVLRRSLANTSISTNAQFGGRESIEQIGSGAVPLSGVFGVSTDIPTRFRADASNLNDKVGCFFLLGATGNYGTSINNTSGAPIIEGSSSNLNFLSDASNAGIRVFSSTPSNWSALIFTVIPSNPWNVHLRSHMFSYRTSGLNTLIASSTYQDNANQTASDTAVTFADITNVNIISNGGNFNVSLLSAQYISSPLRNMRFREIIYFVYDGLGDTAAFRPNDADRLEVHQYQKQQVDDTLLTALGLTEW